MALTVTQLVLRLKSAVEGSVGSACVVGEIGSLRAAQSGHVYFTLKDAAAQLQCVMYRSVAQACGRVRLCEGMLVELHGSATVWEGRGSLQFTVSRLRPAGQGSLQQQFEALKAKLAAEGLFDTARKRRLPEFPRSVGLITSATGAVIQDMRHRLEQRAPWVQAYLYPVLVQGKGAEIGIARAIRQWSKPDAYGLPPVDYLIVARGGGSMEDLWCFNEEIVARAIAACPIPVVSAVGHETDFTIADFVADLRAPTPTAAIELTTPDAAQLDAGLQQTALNLRCHLARALETARLRLRAAEQGRLSVPTETLAPFVQRLDTLENEFLSATHTRLTEAGNRLRFLAASLSPLSLRATLSGAGARLAAAEQQLRSAFDHACSLRRARLDALRATLTAADPRRALDRGFALVRSADGRLARRSADFAPGDELHISLAEGSLRAAVLPPAESACQVPQEGV